MQHTFDFQSIVLVALAGFGVVTLLTGWLLTKCDSRRRWQNHPKH